MGSTDDLLATQYQLSTAIEQLYTNFKKDGADRKNADYIKRKLNILEGYWRDFQTNHVSLCGKGISSHSYFSNNQYEIVKERYENIRATLLNYGKEDSRPSTPIIKPATPLAMPVIAQQTTSLATPGSSQQTGQFISKGTDSKTQDMLRKQASNFRAFKRTVESIDLDLVSEQWEFADILHNLQLRWSVIDSLHWELDSELEGSNQEYENTFSKYERVYHDFKKAINTKLGRVSHRDKVTPQMEVPVFLGNFHQWTSFKNLFIEAIHTNPHLCNAQKMQFLKAKVRGEAERLIQHLLISSDNYNVCWDILNNRFDNKKLIFTSHASILMDIPVSHKLSLNHIMAGIGMHDIVIESLNAIKNLGVDVSSWDPLIVHILTQKLDPESYSDYMQRLKQPRELPVLQEFLEFLESKFTIMETFSRKSDNNNHRSSDHNQNIRKYQKPHHYKVSYPSSSRIQTSSYQNKNMPFETFKCPLCNTNDHTFFYCQKFLEMTPINKKYTVSRLGLCNNCLYNHHGKACFSDKRCRTCNGRHNTILHEADGFTSNRTPQASQSHSPHTSAPNTAHMASTQRSSHVSLQRDMPEILLATAVVKVQGIDGTYCNLRALLDQGSQASLISENAAQRLGLRRHNIKGVISGIGDKPNNCKGAITINCSSIYDDYSFQTDVLIMRTLIKNLPSTTFSKPAMPYLDNIQLADPEFHIRRPVDLLLGADIYSEILLEGVYKSSSILPIAQETRLGWILSGKVNTLHCNVIINNIEDIRKFWEIQDVAEVSTLSEDDQRCIEHYKATTKRRESGYYEVRLPLKANFEQKFGNSKSKAIAQFKQLERKFIHQKYFAQEYKLFINEYMSLGHMTPADGNMKLHCFLPHHGVPKADSTTTSLRVVFNASSKTSSGYSLNDLMERGPNLQQNLQLLIIEWRQYKFAYTADIEKMYRQIWLNQTDQNLQQIVWRNNPNEPLQNYKLATVTYGTKAAPFLAMMTLRQLAQDEKSNYQNSSAISVLEHSFYMDDLVHGAHSIEEAKILQKDLIQLLKSGGFNLRKWKSNSPQLLQEVDCDKNNLQAYNFREPESTKTLGLSWNPLEDTFLLQFKADVPTAPLTKRSLLSVISKLYDPLGWVTPITTKLKILFQKIWLLKSQWDDILPQTITNEWIQIAEDINNTTQFKIQRWLNTKQNDLIELHGFCDSSTKSFSSVIYCKINNQNKSSVVLVAGKARLVPTSKNITLPRLELCGALLLSKLMGEVQKCLKNYKIKTYGWVDSTAVLGWLRGDPGRWTTFVANRVRKICEVMPAECWRYVKSEQNPADCASRGLSASQLQNHQLWWQGPIWLLSYNEENEKERPSYETNMEIKKSKQVNVAMQEAGENIITELLRKHHSISKIIRILAWVYRFISKKQNQKQTAYLSIVELRQAKHKIIKQIQQENFAEEISSIQQKSRLPSKSKLLNLNPFLDKEGILRVGGRLKHANISPEMQHPIILPHSGRFTELIIEHAHQLTFHGGARLTQSFIRQKYWVLGGNRATKKQLYRCVTCRKQNPLKQYQIMGELTEARANASRPFTHVGLDLSGHIFLKVNKGRGVKTTKGYVAVFICMATKAVHLEVVSDLTTSSFMAALRRMMARRGKPNHIYSDNGRNFIGANKVIQQEYQELSARSKWRQARSNIKVNDIVLIHDDNLPPGKWAMGRVMQLHPGSDNMVRVVTLKTKNGFMKRPIIKLSLLPTHDEDDH